MEKEQATDKKYMRSVIRDRATLSWGDREGGTASPRSGAHMQQAPNQQLSLPNVGTLLWFMNFCLRSTARWTPQWNRRVSNASSCRRVFGDVNLFTPQMFRGLPPPDPPVKITA